MPNTPALVQTGAHGLYAGEAVSTADRDLASQVLASTGLTLWVNSEAQIDAVTAVSGSGPAYFFYMMESMIRAGKNMGLKYDDLKLLDPNTVALRELYTELEFRNQLQSLDHPNNPNGATYKQATKSITTTASVANAPEVEDQADKTSVDDQLGEARYHTVLNQDDWDILFKRLSTENRFILPQKELPWLLSFALVFLHWLHTVFM